MARILLVLIALWPAAVACTPPFYCNPIAYTINHGELEVSWRLVAAQKYIPGVYDEIKSPREFFRDGGGDCFDFSSALVYLLGPESDVIETTTPSGKHALVEYRGLIVEPQIMNRFYSVDDITIVNRFSYREVMELVTNYGTKALGK